MSTTEQQSMPLGNADASRHGTARCLTDSSNTANTVVAGLSRYGEEAMRLHPPAAGARVLDVGCGFRDTTRELAALFGVGGSVLGVDGSPRFIGAARHDALRSVSVEFRDRLA